MSIIVDSFSGGSISICYYLTINYFDREPGVGLIDPELGILADVRE